MDRILEIVASGTLVYAVIVGGDGLLSWLFAASDDREFVDVFTEEDERC